MKLSTKTRRAMKAYGADACLEAYRMHYTCGEGASTIALSGPASIKTTPQADAAIAAGEELHATDCIPDSTWVSAEQAGRMAYAEADAVGMPVTVIRTAGSHGWKLVSFVADAVCSRRPATLMGFTALPSIFFTKAWRA